MNRSRFDAAERRRESGVFGTSLSQGQVEGLEAVLNEASRRHTPLNDLGYKLASDYSETAHTMQPIHERWQRSYFNKYEPVADAKGIPPWEPRLNTLHTAAPSPFGPVRPDNLGQLIQKSPA
ncbi:hypothetical protein [Chelativorans salis]|uniref:Uncharacterized protein n=1 Tax=Chelativorans salis TaxID=2978478 RepID=A0ABT2LUG2_9HYPH|nr:hypothetical protein [Chelativorans sp. EGI FJ00035]MCT7378175.1 hypothetical protein [Chelativorans sp. EGI FJ00035]